MDVRDDHGSAGQRRALSEGSGREGGDVVPSLRHVFQARRLRDVGGTDRVATALDALVSTWLLMTSPAVGIFEDDGIIAGGTGGQVPYCNQILVVAEPSDPERALANAINFYEERGLRFVLQVPHGSKVMEVAPSLGLNESGLLPFMVLDPIADNGWRAPGAELEIERARTLDDVAEINQLLHESFEMPMDSVETFALQRFIDNDDFNMFVGRVNGETVTTATSIVAGETAGVFQVATFAQHRGKGYGEIMTAHVTRIAADAGSKIAYLQASGLGFPIYKRMGFQTAASHTLFERPR